jgi:hypothetical protein
MAFGLLLVCMASCSDDTTTTTKDAAVDKAVIDRGPQSDGVPQDGRADVPADGPPKVADQGADLPQTDGGPKTDLKTDVKPNVDQSSDKGPQPDSIPAVDGPYIPPEKIIFSINTLSSNFNLSEVMTDGTGFKTLTGIPLDISFCPINLAGQEGSVDVRRDRPITTSWGSERAIQLPNDRGRLHLYQASGQIGLLHIKMDGTVSILLDQGVGTSCTQLTPYRIAVSPDGALAAVAQSKNKIHLIRLDGTNWPSTTSPVLDVTPASWAINLIYDQSLTLTTQYLFFVTSDSLSTSARTLYSAPLNGTAKAQKVVLPNVGGVPPDFLDNTIAISADRASIAVTAGSTASAEEVILIKEGPTFNMTILSGGTDSYASPGNAFMDDSFLYPQLAISPTHKQVAFARAGTPAKLYVVKENGTGKTELSIAANFSPLVDKYGGFFWADDDNLLFWAGTTLAKLNLFRYKVSTGALQNVTKSGAAVTAPWGDGALSVNGGWLSPNGQHMYYRVETGQITNPAYVLEVNLSTFAATNISSGLWMAAATSSVSIMDSLEGHAGSPYVWFFARQQGVSPSTDNVYMFDQNAGTVPQNLTNHQPGTVGFYLDNLAISPSGAYASYFSGGGASAKLWVVSNSGGAPTPLTSGSYMAAAYAWTNSSSGIAYGAATGSSSQLELIFAPVTGGISKTIYNTAKGYIYVFPRR